VLIQVRVIPRGERDEISGVRNGSVLVRVGAAPVDGKANAAVRKIIARTVGVPPSRVSIVRGETNRDKTVRIDDVADEAAAVRALGLESPTEAGEA
jgi:uncharacterized protein (TIGR00251 family)